MTISRLTGRHHQSQSNATFSYKHYSSTFGMQGQLKMFFGRRVKVDRLIQPARTIIWCGCAPHIDINRTSLQSAMLRAQVRGGAGGDAAVHAQHSARPAAAKSGARPHHAAVGARGLQRPEPQSGHGRELRAAGVRSILDSTYRRGAVEICCSLWARC